MVVVQWWNGVIFKVQRDVALKHRKGKVAMYHSDITAVGLLDLVCAFGLFAVLGLAGCAGSEARVEKAVSVQRDLPEFAVDLVSLDSWGSEDSETEAVGAEEVVENEDEVSPVEDFPQSDDEKACSDIHFGALEAPKQAKSSVRPSEGPVSYDSQKVAVGVESEISEPEKAPETVVSEPAAKKNHEHDVEMRTVYQEVGSRSVFLDLDLKNSDYRVFVWAADASGNRVSEVFAGYTSQQNNLIVQAKGYMPAGGQVVLASRAASQLNANPTVQPGRGTETMCTSCGEVLSHDCWWQ